MSFYRTEFWRQFDCGAGITVSIRDSRKSRNSGAQSSQGDRARALSKHALRVHCETDSACRLQFFPGRDREAAHRPGSFDVFVEVEIELPIHGDGFYHTRALVTIGVVAAAATGETGFGELEAQNSFHEDAT